MNAWKTVNKQWIGNRPSKLLMDLDYPVTLAELADLFIVSNDTAINSSQRIKHDFLPTLFKASEFFRDFTFSNGRKAVWWLGVGTVLGMYRDQGFLPWETDVDIRVLLNFNKPFEAKERADNIAASLQNKGFELCRELYWKGRPMQYAFLDLNNNNAILDIYFFYKGYKAFHLINCNHESFRAKPSYLVSLRKCLSWPGEPDLEVFVPWPTQNYLCWRFGPEWNIPKTPDALGAIDNTCLKPIPGQ